MGWSDGLSMEQAQEIAQYERLWSQVWEGAAAAAVRAATLRAEYKDQRNFRSWSVAAIAELRGMEVFPTSVPMEPPHEALKQRHVRLVRLLGAVAVFGAATATCIERDTGDFDEALKAQQAVAEAEKFAWTAMERYADTLKTKDQAVATDRPPQVD